MYYLVLTLHFDIAMLANSLLQMSGLLLHFSSIYDLIGTGGNKIGEWCRICGADEPPGITNSQQAFGWVSNK